MPKYRKKPVVIEAFQMTEDMWRSNDGRWPQWAKEAWDKDRPEGAMWVFKDEIFCGGLERVHAVTFGDWIIKDIEGGIYPCKPDTFEATYDAA